jgi:hypothetical protein
LSRVAGAFVVVALPKVRKPLSQCGHFARRAKEERTFSGGAVKPVAKELKWSQPNATPGCRPHHQRRGCRRLGGCCWRQFITGDYFLDKFNSLHSGSRDSHHIMASAGATWAQVRQQARAAETQVCDGYAGLSVN